MQEQAPQGTPRRNWWKVFTISAFVFFALLVGGCSMIMIATMSGGGGNVGGDAGEGGKDAFVRIGGTIGIPISCSIDDASGSRTVDTRVPDTIALKTEGVGSLIGASCQKQGAGGMLKVAIVIDGKVEAQQSSDAAYGLVAITHGCRSFS